MRAWAVLLMLQVAGCRQLIGIDDPVEGTPSDGRLSDAPHTGDGPNTDGGTDGPLPTDCYARWTNNPSFSAPAALATLNTGGDDENPFLLSNELVIYFTRDGDIYRAARGSLLEPFGSALAVSSLNSGSNEGKAFVNDAETRVFFASDRGGGSGGWDLWRGSRAGSSGSFGVDRMYVGSLDDSGAQEDPHMTADMLHVYYADGTIGKVTLATRATINDDFSNATQVGNLASGASDWGPTLSADERVIVFASTRSGFGDLYYATRTSAAGSFGAPQQVPGVNMASIESTPHLSPDGCRLYFSSARNGNQDLFVVQMQ